MGRWLLRPVFPLRVFAGLPLHVVRAVCAAALQRDDVIDDVARTRARRAAGARAGVQSVEGTAGAAVAGESGGWDREQGGENGSTGHSSGCPYGSFRFGQRPDRRHSKFWLQYTSPGTHTAMSNDDHLYCS